MIRPIACVILCFASLVGCASATTNPLHLSDCQTGAAADCVPGNDRNAGTEASPKRTLSAALLNDLPAGATVLLKRGGAWGVGMLDLDNRDLTTAKPLTVAAYGQGPAPIVRAQRNQFVEIGRHNDRPVSGGYVFRGLVLDGAGSAQWGFFLRGVRGLTLEDVEITGFKMAIHAQNTREVRNSDVTLRRVTIVRNSEMGVLGDADNLLIEDSRFEGNNFSGSNYNHAIYLGGSGRNGIIRRNSFINNSAVDGVCRGGNLTVHGQWDGLLIEGNTVRQAASDGPCYGIVVNNGYTTKEWFRNLVVRGNKVFNVGGCSICLTSAPGAIVENNLLVNDQKTYQRAILLPSSTYEGGDEPDGGAVIRNNVVCQAAPADGSGAVSATGATVTGTVYQKGPAATTGACAR